MRCTPFSSYMKGKFFMERRWYRSWRELESSSQNAKWARTMRQFIGPRISTSYIRSRSAVQQFYFCRRHTNEPPDKVGHWNRASCCPSKSWNHNEKMPPSHSSYVDTVAILEKCTKLHSLCQFESIISFLVTTDSSRTKSLWRLRVLLDPSLDHPIRPDKRS